MLSAMAPLVQVVAALGPAPAACGPAPDCPAVEDATGDPELATPAVVDCTVPAPPPLELAGFESRPADCDGWFLVSRDPGSHRPPALAPVALGHRVPAGDRAAGHGAVDAGDGRGGPGFRPSAPLPPAAPAALPEIARTVGSDPGFVPADPAGADWAFRLDRPPRR